MKKIEIGIDSFASIDIEKGANNPEASVQALDELLDRIKLADDVGLDFFGIGEHYRKEFLDSSPVTILAAAAAITKNIRLGSAVTVLSAADPVRIFQSFATLDLISKGRAEIIVGRGSFTESFPLFGLNLNDYDAIFAEKLDLLLKIRKSENITWEGKYRPKLENQAIYPRPIQEKIPISLGVGGTPESFARAGVLGLPLTVAVIGGETHRFRPLIDLYRDSGRMAGHAEDSLRVTLHSLGYVSESMDAAIEDYYPGYKIGFSRIGRERGWAPITKERFNSQISKTGAFVVGSSNEVAEKIVRHSKALGGIDRFTFQMDNAGLTHEQLSRSIERVGREVKPLVDQLVG